MRILLALTLIATIAACLSAPAEAARASKTKMLNRCDTKFAACEHKCDIAPNTTATEFKKCNDACDRAWKSCYRNVDIAYPSRRGGGSDGDITFGTEGVDEGVDEGEGSNRMSTPNHDIFQMFMD